MPQSSTPAKNSSNPYSVSALSALIKGVVENNFDHVRVQGELGRVSRPASGHVYLDLKDDKAVLAGVIWKGSARKIPLPLEQGLEVICTGHLTAYAQQSRYQLTIDHIEPAGQGALMALLEARRQKLTQQGVFAQAAKKPLPAYPRVVGVITSPGGAVIRDILHRLRERFACHVLVWPVAVQGENCADEVVKAMEGFSTLPANFPRPEVLIIARGGGSFEDLWPFQEERVVMAASTCPLPIVSAIGHETDTTLLDHVADLRAPTPTAAAEKIVPVKEHIIEKIELNGRRLRQQVQQAMGYAASILRERRRFFNRPATELLAASWQRHDELSARLSAALQQMSQRYQTRLAQSTAALSPLLIQEKINSTQQRLSTLETRLRPTELLAASRHRHDALSARLSAALQQMSQRYQTRLTQSTAALSPLLIQEKINSTQQRLRTLETRLRQGVHTKQQRARERANAVAKTLQAYSYKRVLARGFSLVRQWDGTLVRHAQDLAEGAPLDIEFSTGPRLSVEVTASRAREKHS